MEQSTMTMGKRIAAHRKRLKMTQDALAQELGVSAQAVSKWENDLSCPDISMLPGIAKIFGITVDELLGVAKPEEVREAEVVHEFADGQRGIHFESDDGRTFNLSFGSPRGQSIAVAAWFIAMGAMMLAGLALDVAVGLWSAAWTTFLVVFGIFDLTKHIRASNILCTLVGVYFVGQKLDLIGFTIGAEVVLPVLLVVLGVSFLLDSGKKKKHIAPPQTAGAAEIVLEDGFLAFSHAGEDGEYTIAAPELKGADINLSFCDFVMDFSGVQSVAEDCRVKLNTSYGDIELRVPSRFRVNIESTRSFSEIAIQGQPDANPQGTIHLTGNCSFGDLEIQYI